MKPRSGTAGRTVAIALLMLLAHQASAADAAREPYNAALAREQVVRAVLDELQATPAVLAEVRAVVTAYELVVRRHPTSGYCDNALWQAAQLSLDAFARFAEPRDKAAGVHLLETLAREYPTSKLAKQAPTELAAIDAPAAGRQHAASIEPPRDATADPVAPKPDAPAVRPRQDGAAARPLATIRDIRRTVLPDAVRVTIEIDAEVPFHEERLDDPARVFVDLPATRTAATLLDRTLQFQGDADIVRQVRIGRHPNNTTRVVLDAAGMSGYSVYPLYDPYRIVIDCARAAPIADTAASVLLSGRIAIDSRPPPPSVEPRATPSSAPPGLDGAPASQAPVAPEGTVAPSPEPARTAGDTQQANPAAALPSRNLTGRFSIARQLGLGVSRIVIDPGHGGHDTGAKGTNITEAELVLDVALRLEKLLEKVPGVEVILTRRKDDFVPLQERTAIANRENADLFLSIHANASANAEARGVETYFLNFATTLSAAAVAARENAASGQAMGALPDFVKAIALNNKLDESRDLAAQVQRAMIERLRGSNKAVKDLGVKQAPFAVLIGAAMPSVLTEISFVTNPQEAKLLRSSAYRQRIAEALTNAVRKYQTSLKRVNTVAQQH